MTKLTLSPKALVKQELTWSSCLRRRKSITVLTLIPNFYIHNTAGADLEQLLAGEEVHDYVYPES